MLQMLGNTELMLGLSNVKYLTQFKVLCQTQCCQSMFYTFFVKSICLLFSSGTEVG